MLSRTRIWPPALSGRSTLSRVGLLAVACLVALASLASTASAAQLPVSLGAADGFAVLAGSTVTNAGFSTVNGDLGVSPGTAVTGFPPGKVNGTIHAADPVAAAAQGDLTAAYNDAAGRTPPNALPADVGGQTLIPGVYNSGAALGLTGTLTLDGQGDPNAVFVFQIGSALTTAVSSQVNLINGAQASNVFWQIGSSATLGTSSVFAGTIMALSSISMNDGVTLNGRALARNGAVTLVNDTINAAPTASPPPPPPPPAGGDTRPPAPPLMVSPAPPLLVSPRGARSSSARRVLAARAPITVRGNPLLINFIRPIADAYTKRSGQRVVLAFDPALPVDELAKGSINIQLRSRAKRANDPADYVSSTFARDPICVVTNNKNPLRGLSRRQVGVLFGDPRKVAEWKNVPGHRVRGGILLAVPNSFQLEFGDIFGLGSDYRLWRGMPTPDENVTRITTGQSPTALAALPLTATRSVHPVPIAGIRCTLRNAKSGQYKYSRPFVMETKGRPSGVVASFVRFARSSAFARRYIGQTRVPVRR